MDPALPPPRQQRLPALHRGLLLPCRGSTEVLIVFLLARAEDGPGVVELAVGAHPMVAAPFRMPASVQERLGAHNNTHEYDSDCTRSSLIKCSGRAWVRWGKCPAWTATKSTRSDISNNSTTVSAVPCSPAPPYRHRPAPPRRHAAVALPMRRQCAAVDRTSFCVDASRWSSVDRGRGFYRHNMSDKKAPVPVRRFAVGDLLIELTGIL